MSSAAPLYPPKATPSPAPSPVSASGSVPESQGAAAPTPQITALQNPPRAVASSPVASTSASASPSENLATPTPSTSSAKTTTSAPRPVMSAKAAINAMYAAEKHNPSAKLVPSAREAVNAASRLAPKNFKSASNLHHGSLQKIQKVQPTPRSIESTRTSASALIRTAGSDRSDVPVVHTSLKLGSSAKPKHEPVVLPAGSRMAEAARPVANPSDTEGMVMVGRASSGSRGGAMARVITSSRPQIAANSRSRRMVRDPQMLSGGRRVLPSNSQAISALPASGAQSASGVRAISATHSAQSTPVRLSSGQANRNSVSTAVNRAAHYPQSPQTASVTSVSATSVQTSQASASSARSMDMTSARKLVRPRRFRTAPKNYAEADSSAVSVDSSYAIAEPPKLAVRRRGDSKSEDLGVVKNYHPSKLPEPIGDAAPIGRLAEQRVAAGSGGPARPEPTIKAENTSSYSFSRRDSKSKTTPYAPADKSPFLKSVTVEKRPLSDSSVPTPISLPRTAEAKPEKASRKNSYQKKSDSRDAKAELPSRPTVIVPSSRRSKAPLFFLILFTIILGAAVGAAVYLCFFQ